MLIDNEDRKTISDVTKDLKETREQVKNQQPPSDASNVVPEWIQQKEKEKELKKNKEMERENDPKKIKKFEDTLNEGDLPALPKMVMPGDNINMEVELIVAVALEQGSKFAIREGGLTVGAGVITKILD